jgi:DNA polymerase III alpha subunit
LEIDPEDEKTGELLASGDTLGVFQAESPGMRHLCRQLRVRTRAEMTVALSVIRPGPAGSGMKAAYIRRHLGQEQPRYAHPRLAELIGRTHGVMIYQEDTMRVAVGVAGFTPAEADMLRKAVSKKRSPRRMAELRERFITKAMVHTPGMGSETADDLWRQIAQFASYSFCRAHACVYGRIAWQTAWLKAHHPRPFYTAVFNNHQGMYPMRVHVGDAIRHGVRVLGPHANHSDADSRLTADGAIRLGLNFVRDLSRRGIERIIAGRRDAGYADLNRLRLAAKLAEPELVNLIRCGACDGLGEHRNAMLAEVTLEEPVELISSVECRASSEGEICLATHSRSDTRHAASSRFPWTKPFTDAEALQAEIDVLGLFLTHHPMDMATGDWISTADLPSRVGQRVVVAGVLDATRTVQTQRKQLMRFVTLEDRAGLVECTFFPDAYRRFGHLFYHVGPFRVEGIVEEDRGAITINATRAESLVEACPLKWTEEE